MSPRKANAGSAQRPARKRAKPADPKRSYHSPLRKQQLAETRERIIAAGAELVHSFPAWDWTNLNAGAVGERAGVSERTVHRHFASERQLRDAVLQRLVEESGISLEDLRLEQFADATARMFRYLSSFGTKLQPVEDPSFRAMDEVRRQALLAAVERSRPQWTAPDRELAAAALDILWNLPPYERLITAWGLEPARAITALTWLIQLVEEAILADRRPIAAKPRTSRR